MTLIEIETIDALARDHAIALHTSQHHYNLTTQDVSLNHMVDKQFWVANVLLEGGRLNTPRRYFDLITGQTSLYPRYDRFGLNCNNVPSDNYYGDMIRPQPCG